MNFWNHIDDLRKALLYPVLVLVVLTVVAFLFKETLFEILLAANSSDFVTYSIAPDVQSTNENSLLVKLINVELPAQLLIHMKVSFYVGLILTIPYLFFKLFRFAAPGLYKNERYYSARIIFFSFISFLAGIMVNYFIIFPFSLRFLVSYQVANQVENMISLTSYLDTLMTLSVLMGICFELPVVSLLFSKLGLIESGSLKKYRKHAVVAVIIVSAIITPTTDIFTLLLVSIPIAFLYEFSIVLMKISERSSSIAKSEK